MAEVTQPTSDRRTGSRPSGARVLVLGIFFKLTMIFHLGVLARQCPITLGYSAPAFDESRYRRSFGLFVCTNRTCGVVRVIDHGLLLWQLLRAGSYDTSLLCAAYKACRDGFAFSSEIG
jgi:hypothetical protein